MCGSPLNKVPEELSIYILQTGATVYMLYNGSCIIYSHDEKSLHYKFCWPQNKTF